MTATFLVICLLVCYMARKVGTSVALTQEQLRWVDEQDGSNSEVVRVAIDYYRENHD